jgi:hypothetical protein
MLLLIFPPYDPTPHKSQAVEWPLMHTLHVPQGLENKLHRNQWRCSALLKTERFLGISAGPTNKVRPCAGVN